MTTLERNPRKTWTLAASDRFQGSYRRYPTALAMPHCGSSSSLGPLSSRRIRIGLDIRAGGASRPSARPLTWHGLIRFSSDRVHKVLIEALACGFSFSPDDSDDPERFADYRAFQSCGGKDRLQGHLGFRLPPTERERELLADHRAQLLKLQFSLWARAFAETDADPGRPTVVTLSQLCEDLGYRRLQNGAHRPEHKRQVAEWLELLTSIEVEAEYQAPDGRRTQLHGPLWRRFPDWEGDRSFAYAPGAWYADAIWSRYNRRVGLIGAGLLSLRPDRDRWAISVGAYLATLVRMNGYRPLILRVATVLECTGLAEAERRNPSRMREMLERALEQLESSGIIAEWDWLPTHAAEPDMEAPDDLARLADDAPHWVQRSLIIRWPTPLRTREEALRTRRDGQVTRGRTLRTRTVPNR